ncbi:MAG: hypothetical protein WKF97_23225 [Chitinophagaceae bacterium]
MNKPRLNYLFHAYFSKSATREERDELMELLKDPENDEQVKNLLTKTLHDFNGQEKLFNVSQGKMMVEKIVE